MNKLHSKSGSALILALVFAIVIGAAGATAYQILQSRLRQAHQTASWQESLLAAESGVDLAVDALRTSIQDPTGAWANWHQSTDEILDGTTTSTGTIGAAPSATATYITSTVLLRTSEGGARSWCEVQVDAPVELLQADGTQWYRVRSLGIAEIPGSPTVAGDKVDLNLRKFDSQPQDGIARHETPGHPNDRGDRQAGRRIPPRFAFREIH